MAACNFLMHTGDLLVFLCSGLVQQSCLVYSLSCLFWKSPLSAYRHFVLEQRFGFNRMTVKIFISDTVKNALLGFAIGTH